MSSPVPGSRKTRRGVVQLVASVYGMPHVTASSACSAVSLRQPEGGAEVYGVRTEVVQSSQPVRFNRFLCRARVVGCGVYDIAAMMSM
jgi:hypothetical protein